MVWLSARSALNARLETASSPSAAQANDFNAAPTGRPKPIYSRATAPFYVVDPAAPEGWRLGEQLSAFEAYIDIPREFVSPNAPGVTDAEDGTIWIRYSTAPVIETLTPSTGPDNASTPVTITGVNLTGTTSVTFGGVAATAVVVVDESTVTCTVAAGAAGTLAVVLTSPNGTATASWTRYSTAPTISNLAPSTGAAAGGTAVTITGTNLTGTSGVTFGGIAATAVVVVNSTTVTCTTPARPAGSQPVVLTTPSGTANTTFTYTP